MPPAKQLVLFVVDGLRPDAVTQAATPWIDTLVARGAHTWQAQTVMPSVTLPCHTSMLYGVPPSRHGVVSNEWTPARPLLPGLFEIVHRAGLGTAAFYTWEPLRDLTPLGTLDMAYYRRLGEPGGDRDLEIGTLAAAYIAEQQPALSFVYLGAADAAGHRHGWMSPPYLQAISQADRAIGQVVQALRSSGSLDHTACLVLADHGGHDLNHEAGTAEDLTIPWVISGVGVRRGHTIARPVHITDTAPTIAHLLGLPEPPEWTGRPVVEALAT
jgi:predicted AlkP superfamily pyrophosphatase or phosphodiesterase